MKNKRVLMLCLSSMISIILAFIFTILTFMLLKNFLDYKYRVEDTYYINILWYAWRSIKGTTIGDIAILSSGLVVFLIYYILIIFNKVRKFIDLVDQTSVVSDGDLEKVVETKSKGELKVLVNNINGISNQLKSAIEKERQAQQTKNDLITNVSHDLRTPLTSIIGYLDIIDSDKYEDEVKLRYYANIAHEKAKSLNLLINDLFELTKMQNYTVSLNKTTINLVDLLGQIAVYFEYQVKEANMKLRANFSEDKLIINGDGEKLVRVFENLLTNAIKYGEDGCFIDITTKLEDDMAIVQIINYGDPIPSIDLPYIFDRFYRVEKSRNSSIGGSGLGLAITKNIIILHHGSIRAFSDEHKTIFEVMLPVIVM